MVRRDLVHWRAVKYVLDVARRAGLDGAAIVAGLPFDEASLPRHKWVHWEDYCATLERLQELCGGPEALQRLGLEREAIGDLRQFARAFAGPVQLFRFMFQVVLPITFPLLAFGLEVLSDCHLRVTRTIPDGARACAALGHSSVGFICAIPTYLGLPPAEVDATIDDRRMECLVTLPGSPTVATSGAEEARAAGDAMLAYNAELTGDLLRATTPPDIERRLLAVQSAHRLTERQATVVSHVVKGRSNKEIARALRCAESTVELHLSGVFRKLGCASRAQLIARFWSAA